ncbi:MAG: hypothetical protein ACYC6W_11780 [Nitrosotalea sp.]
MGQTIRVSLPGYDALTDTNLDHFALYTDQDNILIKEFSRGNGTVAQNGTLTVTHGLGYVPFFLTYMNLGGGTSALVQAFCNNGASAPDAYATSDSGTMYITNFDAQTNFRYYIFYDNFTNNLGSFTQSSQALKISKQGIDTGTATSPNLFIFHSDLNTFKIIKEGSININYTGSLQGTYSFAHNSGLGTPSAYMAFMKFPDGKTAILPGVMGVYSYDSNYNVYRTTIDANNITMLIQGTGNATLPVKYYVFETPV